MTEYKEVIFNVETGETIERPFTKEEIESVKAEIAAAETKAALEMAQMAKNEAAKNALLEKLGITKDEAALLLS